MRVMVPPRVSTSRRVAAWRLVPFLAIALGLGAAAAPQDTVFRSAVDLIAVDVQVVDRDGIPVGEIGPESFTVSINGAPRRVISAQFVRQAESSTVGLKGAKAVPRAVVEVAPVSETGRTFILAVDNSSFAPGTTGPAMEAAQHFIDALDPHDKVGLYVYPSGPRLEPTTERARIRSDLARVTGEKWMPHSRFNLAPSEVIDMTAALGMGIQTRQNVIALDGTIQGAPGAGQQSTQIPPDWDTVVRVMRRECPGQADCASNILNDVASLAPHLENQAATSLNGLGALLRGLAEMPGRKAVVLVSAGVLVSDRKDGRPDVGDMSRVLGQIAAMANATVYSVQVESASSIASTRLASSANNRDRLLYGNWLDEFSAAAGGTRIYVPVGAGGFAFDRVLRETSAHYLLGVQPEESDRDGRPRQLKVKVARPGVNVQSRQWVVIPAKNRAD